MPCAGCVIPERIGDDPWNGGKRGNQSVRVALPLTETPKTPDSVEVKYDASNLTVSWTAPADARMAIQRAPEKGELPAKPVVDSGGVTTYNVYDAKALAEATQP